MGHPPEQLQVRLSSEGPHDGPVMVHEVQLAVETDPGLQKGPVPCGLHTAKAGGASLIVAHRGASGKGSGGGQQTGELLSAFGHAFN